MNNVEFNSKINELWSQTKSGELSDRQTRFSAVEELTERCFSANGKLPEVSQLDRLSTLCLYEEITDDTAWKTRQSEYPFLSDEQLARRKDGVHQRKNEAGQREVGLKKAWAVSPDGKDNSKPIRRERSDNENIQIDTTKSRNKERRDKYQEFTKVQPVIIRHLGGDLDSD